MPWSVRNSMPRKLGNAAILKWPHLPSLCSWPSCHVGVAYFKGVRLHYNVMKLLEIIPHV